MEENRRLDDRELENVSGGTSENPSQDILVVREILNPVELEFMSSVFDREMVFKTAKDLGYRIFEIKGCPGGHYASVEKTCGVAPGDHVELDYFRDGMFGYEIVNYYHK